MRKNCVLRLGALAIALTLITTGMMGSTLARYVSEAVGDGTVAVAAWKVKMKNGDAELDKKFEFTLASTKKQNSLVDSAAVAPGDAGELNYVISDEGSGVAYSYSVTIDDESLKNSNANIKFYKDPSYTTDWEDITAKASVNGAVDTGKIYWVWKDEESNNENDTKAGIAAGDLSFTITMTAKQTLAGENP